MQRFYVYPTHHDLHTCTRQLALLFITRNYNVLARTTVSASLFDDLSNQLSSNYDCCI